jgi:hypothetical protein
LRTLLPFAASAKTGQEQIGINRMGGKKTFAASTSEYYEAT